MNIKELIAQHILDVHEGDNWTESNIKIALADVTLAEAITKTPASPNTIAMLLHHLTYWNRIMVERISGIKSIIPETNGFEINPLVTEEDWQQLKNDNMLSAHKLASSILNFDESKLLQPILPGYSSAYKNLQGSSEHIHYHLGQIIILKNLIRSSKI
ncbi:DinB family protein [Flavobacterium zepuense]|uniref:DinB family protein n=1 Tax=Flavobacterium zepuense TaxID=2593302 RepID=A0A552V1V7_9FLAO|nr:DinB family protein [Flavobacterium zepuense]TRW24428.1 DinB family protein [Flavobacterium zepuense]